MNVDTHLAPRRMLYRLLALAFYEPSAALDEVLESETAVVEFEQAARLILGEEGTRLVRAMVDAFHQTTDDLDLTVEYNRLFVGPGALPCPPYQSVYDKTRSSEDQGTVWVRPQRPFKQRCVKRGSA
jgi:TorA maturation chaperone TorD